MGLREAANAQREAKLAKSEAAIAQRRATLSQEFAMREATFAQRVAIMAQREQAVQAREVSSGCREQALLLENAELKRQLASEKAAAATAVEMHQGTKAAVKVKKEHVEDLEDAGKCKVCFERAANVVFSPCGHCSTCQACADGLPLHGEENRRRCVICRADIIGTSVIIMS